MLQRGAFLLCLVFALAFLEISVLSIVIRTRKSPTLSSVTIGTRASSVLSGSMETLFHSNECIPNTAEPNDQLTFSIVPASANPSNKFTTQLLEDILPNKLHATDAKLLDESNGGRLTFCVPAILQHSNATEAPNGSKWSEILSPYGVKSLRLVVCECNVPSTLWDEDGNNTKPSLVLPDRQEFILKILKENLPEPELPWKIYHEFFGNTPRPLSSTGSQPEQPTSLNVSCRRWSSSRAISKKEFSSTTMKHALKRMLLQKYDRNSNGTPSRWPNDCEFTLLIFENKLRLEWTILVPPKSKKFSEPDYLPKPGCKRVEAWMLMKNLEETVIREIRERRVTHQRNGSDKKSANEKKVVVLDPLCGKATFLVEAATTWNTGVVHDGVSVLFVGVDASDAQLRDARRNVDAVTDSDEDDTSGGEESRGSSAKNDRAMVVKRRSHDQTSTTTLYKGDSRDLSRLGFKDGSVTAIATCPPFGRQFFALETGDGSDDSSTISSNYEDVLAASYRDWLHEWARILNPHNGRIALLVDIDHREEALDAIASTGSLHVAVLREPFRLGRVMATVIVADAMLPHNSNHDTNNSTTLKILPDPLSRFPWEGNAKEARAEWTRLRAASLQGLEPYTKAQRD